MCFSSGRKRSLPTVVIVYAALSFAVTKVPSHPATHTQGKSASNSEMFPFEQEWRRRMEVCDRGLGGRERSFSANHDMRNTKIISKW